MLAVQRTDFGGFGVKYAPSGFYEAVARLVDGWSSKDNVLKDLNFHLELKITFMQSLNKD